MSFTTKITFTDEKEPSKALLVGLDPHEDKNTLSLAILGPNGQQSTFKVGVADFLVGLRAIFPDYIKLSE